MPNLTLTFLGSGDAFGSGGRLQASIHVARKRGGAFLLDCGCTVMIALRRLNFAPNDISAILISHLHGDHFGGLPFFILDAQLVSKRTSPLKIIAPPGGKEKIEAMMQALFPGSVTSKKPFTVTIEELSPLVPHTGGDFTVTAYPVNHSGLDALALRVEADGRAIAYSGDTEWVDNLIPCAANADLFIAEAYSLRKKIKFHLDLADLWDNMDKINARQYVLTHMSQDVLDRPDEEFKNCLKAYDGLTVNL